MPRYNYGQRTRRRLENKFVIKNDDVYLRKLVDPHAVLKYMPYVIYVHGRKRKSGADKAKRLMTRIFNEFMTLAVDDMIENNVVIQLPIPGVKNQLMIEEIEYSGKHTRNRFKLQSVFRPIYVPKMYLGFYYKNIQIQIKLNYQRRKRMAHKILEENFEYWRK